MKKYILLYLVILPVITSAQNNVIFGGGTDDGHAATRTETQTNNPIFRGGVDDGYAASRTESTTNNSIFLGGIDDGYASSRTETPTNNSIFDGGADDGHATARTERPSNNDIFGGGIDDGYARIVFDGIPLRLPPILDLDWLGVDVRAEGSRVLIQWSTHREPGVGYFEVERRQDPDEPILLSEKVYSKGSEEGGARYSFWDTKPVPGSSHYRIKVVDLDGEISYSSWKSLWFDKEASLRLSAFPNPVQGRLNLHIESMQIQHIELQLTDINGRLLWTKSVDVAFGSLDTYIEMGGFAEGMYIIELKTSEGVQKVLRVLKTE